MDQTIDTGGSNWADWFQGVVGGVVSKAADATYVKPYDIQSLRLQALGNGGYYTEGMPGTQQRTMGGIPTGMLLLAGAAVVAVLLLKD